MRRHVAPAIPSPCATLPLDLADERSLKLKQAAVYLGISADRLRRFPPARGGPPRTKVNGRVYTYPLSELRAWRAAHTERSKS